jgi:GNAT superfamily N-acetyltransferase
VCSPIRFTRPGPRARTTLTAATLAPAAGTLAGVTTLIRAARSEDAAALVALYEAWEHAQPVEVVAERLSAWAAAPQAQVLVAEVDGAVAGFAGVCAVPHLARPGRFARLSGLAVGAPHRRRGVGAALVRAAEELGRRWDCDAMEITSSRRRADAPGFYRALGYDDVCERSARFMRSL